MIKNKYIYIKNIYINLEYKRVQNGDISNVVTDLGKNILLGKIIWSQISVYDSLTYKWLGC